ncbi:MAG: cupin, partial [Cyanobacteria bacterium K_DeepCast_35m_m1_288]|nr:cupin [Cyanobacteria bacterium K_DeepCast_35m_m1_288]
MTQAPERKRHDEPAASKALLFDYRQAANPVRPGLTDPIPYRSWGPELHQQGTTGILPLDLSAELGVTGPATSPALAAHFIRIEAGEGVRAAAEVTSSLFFV